MSDDGVAEDVVMDEYNIFVDPREHGCRRNVCSGLQLPMDGVWWSTLLSKHRTGCDSNGARFDTCISLKTNFLA